MTKQQEGQQLMEAASAVAQLAGAIALGYYRSGLSVETKADGSPVDPGPGADNPVAIGPAGIVHCSIGDWAKFAKAAGVTAATTKLVADAHARVRAGV